MILCLPNQIAGLWSAMGRPELADDPRFSTQEARVAHRDELTELIETWLAGFATTTRRWPSSSATGSPAVRC